MMDRRGDEQSADKRHVPDQGRRAIIAAAGGAAGFLLMSTTEATAKQPASSAPDGPDTVAIEQLINYERQARDAGQWDAMLSCYHPDASIDVSWFQGGGAAFVEMTRRGVQPDRLNFHQMHPAVVRVRRDRALATTPCTLQSFSTLEGVDVNMVGHINLLWRAARLQGRWLIAGLRVIYLRDLLIPTTPGEIPKLDAEKLSRFRSSYRFLSYMLTVANHPPRDDLPGIDRPDTVVALRAGEEQWLAAG